MTEPNIAGFKEAQDRLREKLGQDVTFEIPVPKTWDPDTALDPESGEPYDPTAVPTSGGGTTQVVKKVSVVFHPLRTNTKDSVVTEPVGVMDIESVALLVGATDYPDIQDATGFTLNTKEYRITDAVPDGLDGIDRFIIYGQAR